CLTAFLHPDFVGASMRDSRRAEGIALRHFGPRALPRLEWMLRQKDSHLKTRFIRWASNRHLIGLFGGHPEGPTIRLERRMPFIEVRWSPATPRDKAIVGFIILGDLSVPALERALRDPSPEVREATSRVLGELERRRGEPLAL